MLNGNSQHEYIGSSKPWRHLNWIGGIHFVPESDSAYAIHCIYHTGAICSPYAAFFSVASRIISVNGQALQVIEYAQPSKLDREARRVSSNGMTIGTSKPSWLSIPHFYKTEKLIVLYVGDDQTILRILQSTLGDQFAGG
jgi:hypothetical protein